MLVRKRDRVADLEGAGKIQRFVGLEQADCSHQRHVSGIYIAEYLRFGSVAKMLGAGDVELGPQLLALIPVEDAQGKIDAEADVGRIAETTGPNETAGSH